MLAAKRATERFSHADAARLYQRAIEAGRASRIGRRPGAGRRVGADGRGASVRRRAGGGKPGVDRGAPAAARRSDRPGTAVRPSRGRGLAQRGADRGCAMAEARLSGSRGGRRRRSDGVARQDALELGGRPQSAGPLGGGDRGVPAGDRGGRSRSASCSALAHALYCARLGAASNRVAAEEATHSWRALEIYERARRSRARARSSSTTSGMFAYFDGRWDDAIALYRRVAGACGERSGSAGGRGAASTATSARSCPTRAISTRPRSTCSGHAGCGAGRGERASGGVRRRAPGDAWRSGAATLEAGVPMLESAMNEFRRFEHARLRGFRAGPDRRGRGVRRRPGAGARDRARATMDSGDRQRARCSSAPPASRSPVSGGRGGPRRSWSAALGSARERGAEYDVAATIDALHALGGADAEHAPRAGRRSSSGAEDRAPAPRPAVGIEPP